MKQATLITTKSAAADVTSASFDLGDLATFSIEVEFSGSDIVGTLTVESRSDPTYAWKTVAGSSQAVTASADHMWNLSNQGYRFVRVFWDYTSGTGNISAFLSAKGSLATGA